MTTHVHPSGVLLLEIEQKLRIYESFGKTW